MPFIHGRQSNMKHPLSCTKKQLIHIRSIPGAPPCPPFTAVVRCSFSVRAVGIKARRPPRTDQIRSGLSSAFMNGLILIEKVLIFSVTKSADERNPPDAMLVLGIESSCDETAAAVVENGRRILSDVIASQVAVHEPYGGVVPELASRKHVEAILPVIDQALREAGITASGLDAVAVTRGPGLIGALLVGLSAAKAMAYALNKPLIAVNHLEGHMQAAFIEGEEMDRPCVCLVVSGGHTALYRVEPDGSSSLLGSTRDDAAGEAFDKVAKLLNLGYPGGAVIDALSAKGDPGAHAFPRAFMDSDSLEFSFSGIKTAVAHVVRRFGPPSSSEIYRIEDLVASFQEAIVDVLVSKTIKAANRCKLRDIAVVGGVAANRRLRQRLSEEAARLQLNIHLPSMRFCTDNAVMIAAAAYFNWKRSGFCPDLFELDALSRWF